MRRRASGRAGVRWRAAGLALGLTGLALGAGAASGVAMPHGLKLGVAGDPFLSSDAPLREVWMTKARQARANLVYMGVAWSGVAPATRPSGFQAGNPADPAYEWALVDAGVRSAVRHGMQPVLNLNYAPTWAEGPHRPSLEKAPAGTWDPDPRQFGLFARAAARRYSGHFTDPADPGAGPLPGVRYFEVWAEENLPVNLNPLWRGRKLIGPRRYRVMLNEAYAAIHGANSGAKVIVGGLSPYGDPRPGGRVPPVWYWRSLLCLKGPQLEPLDCPDRAHFDIAAHNPINVGGPSRKALNPLDVSTPDNRKITRIVRRAVQTHRVLPAKPKPFWATEIWWDSKPPDPDGVPERRHARFITKALFSLWRQGASAVVWWYIRDQSHATGFSGTQQSGLFFRDGRPKPAYWAFRFPFISGRDRAGGIFVWGKAPVSGPVVIERTTTGGWAPLARVSAGQNQIFQRRIDVWGGFKVRARQGSETSLPWQAR